MSNRTTFAQKLRNTIHHWTGPLNRAGGFAKTAIASLTMALHIKSANKWRDQHNPLRGLTMRRAVSYLEEGERGAYADLQWLYRYVEKRDATLRGGKRSLLSAVSEMDWEIKTVAEDRLPKGHTQADADAQAVTLRTAYDAISNLVEAIEFLGLAEFRGFAHLEKIADGSGTIVKLNPVEQWYWCRDGLNGEWIYNAEARSGRVTGEPADMSRFVVREIDDPINEIALIAFVRKQLSRKDWDGFIESFGIPSIFAIMPQNVPAGKEDEYQQLAEDVIGDSRGALPHGSDVKAVDPGARGTAPFEKHLEALDKEIVMAITSGMLTMLAESGSGTLAGGAHSETFERVARALAKRITSCLQAQFDLEILERAHPGEPPLAYFAILAEEEVDTSKVITDVTGLSGAGYVVAPEWIDEKTGYPVTLKPEAPAVPGQGMLPNRRGGHAEAEQSEDADAEFLDAAKAVLADAMQADFSALAERLQAILSADLDDETLTARLAELRAELPGLATEIGASGETVKAWEAVLGAAAAEGLKDA